MSFRIALSGLNAAATDLSVTGNNIANSSTTGFKESRAEFADVYASSVLDRSATAAGQGVRVARIAQQFSQGVVEFTSNNLDLAINGEGFFVLQDGSGSQVYTRAGAFSADRDGFVVNQALQRLQVYPATTSADGTTIFNTGVLQDLQLPTQPSPPAATTEIYAALNLNAEEQVPPPFDPASPGTYNHSTSIVTYDSLGNSHTATMYFRKTGDNTWDAYVALDGTFHDGTVAPAVPGGPTFDLQFSSTGSLEDPVPPDGLIAGIGPYTVAGGAEPMVLDFRFGDTTQYGGNFAVNSLGQDGFSSGRLSGVDIDADGIVFARYTNGQSSAMGKVALAKFNNTQGLRQIGDTSWVETFPSGDAQLGEAGTSSFGAIQSGALEASTVDIAEQLVNLITAQRNFQANAQVITAADAITQTVINLR
jgi:flagellar hook protein FlgE